MNGGREVDQWVKKLAGPIPMFDPQKEEET
jgi:hypothetical protein